MHLIRYILFLLLLGSLTNCGGNSACVDADDFGFTVVNVSARYKPDEIIGSGTNQIAPWKDYNLELSGSVLSMMVKNWYYGEDLNNKKVMSAWCPWWGSDDTYSHILSPFCVRLRECNYHNNQKCTSPVITNAPCLMKRGVGLYANLQPRNGPNPNASVVTMHNPTGPTIHLGEPLVVNKGGSQVSYKMYDFSGAGIMREAGGAVYNFDGNSTMSSNKINYIRGKLYFKIVDSYYTDNNGQYTVVIKSGLIEPGGDIFTIIKKLVHDRLFGNGDENGPALERYGIVRTIYENIVKEPGFRLAVKSALILYIFITGLLFLMGSITLTHTEVINRTIKVAVITALFNPAVSWDFFNQYVFIWVYEGASFIVQILTDAAKTGPGDSNILTFLTSIQIMKKLSSLLFASWQGWIFILIYLIMLIFLTVVLFNATVLYLTAQVMIGLLICLAPIFISFYLFDKTRSFFDNWLKQLISYAIQTILVSAGILFMTMIIRNQIYNTLGFRVCLREFPDMNTASGGLSSLLQGSDQGDGPVISLFAWWFPEIPGWGDNPIKSVIPIPKAHFVTADDASIGFGFSNSQDVVGDFCNPYECLGTRYPDLPFLDPNNPYEARQMNILRGGDIVDFGGLFIIVVCVYLLHQFNSTVNALAQFLSGTSGNAGSNEGAASSASATLGSYAAAPLKKAGNLLDEKSGLKGLRNKISTGASNVWNEKIVGKAASWVSNRRAEQIEKEALKNTANSATLKKVEQKTGISQKAASEFQDKFQDFSDGMKYNLSKSGYTGAKDGAGGDYKTLDAKGHALADALDKKPAANFESEAAKVLFGKNAELSKLTDSQKTQLDNVMKDQKVKDMIFAKQKQEFFQDAYLQATKESMEEGRGALSSRQREKQQRADMADKHLAWKGELKRYLSGNLLKSEGDQVHYSDPTRRTLNEQIADKEEGFKAKAFKKELDTYTVKEGKDIQRVDFIADLKKQKSELSGQAQQAMQQKIDKYEALTKQAIESDVHQKLKASGAVMGDKFVREKMNEESYNKMLQNIRTQGEAILKNDTYVRQENMYKGDTGATNELTSRKAMIGAAVNAEIERLNNVRFGKSEAPRSITDDVREAIKPYETAANKVSQVATGTIEKMRNTLKDMLDKPKTPQAVDGRKIGQAKLSEDKIKESGVRKEIYNQLKESGIGYGDLRDKASGQKLSREKLDEVLSNIDSLGKSIIEKEAALSNLAKSSEKLDHTKGIIAKTIAKEKERLIKLLDRPDGRNVKEEGIVRSSQLTDEDRARRKGMTKTPDGRNVKEEGIVRSSQLTYEDRLSRMRNSLKDMLDKPKISQAVDGRKIGHAKLSEDKIRESGVRKEIYNQLKENGVGYGDLRDKATGQKLDRERFDEMMTNIDSLGKAMIERETSLSNDVKNRNDPKAERKLENTKGIIARTIAKEKERLKQLLDGPDPRNLKETNRGRTSQLSDKDRAIRTKMIGDRVVKEGDGKLGATTSDGRVVQGRERTSSLSDDDKRIRTKMIGDRIVNEGDGKLGENISDGRIIAKPEDLSARTSGELPDIQSTERAPIGKDSSPVDDATKWGGIDHKDKPASDHVREREHETPHDISIKSDQPHDHESHTKSHDIPDPDRPHETPHDTSVLPDKPPHEHDSTHIDRPIEQDNTHDQTIKYEGSIYDDGPKTDIFGNQMTIDEALNVDKSEPNEKPKADNPYIPEKEFTLSHKDQDGKKGGFESASDKIEKKKETKKKEEAEKRRQKNNKPE